MTKNQIKRILLTALIFLSFFLSYNLWSAGEQTSSENVQVTSQAPASLVDRRAQEVYAPHQMMIHNNATLLTRQNDIMGIFNSTFEEVVFSEVKSVDQLDREAYFQLLNLSVDTWFEVVYDDLVPIGLFEGRFETLPNDVANFGINRVAFNLDHEDDVLMYNSQDETLYTAGLETINLEQMNQLLESEEIGYEDAVAQAVEDDFIYLPAERTEVRFRDYVVERLPNSLYIREFFSDTSEVDVSTSEEETRYIDIATEVRIDNQNHILNYLRQRQDTSELSMTERFARSYTHLNRLENWTNEVHYSEYLPGSQRLVYQRYIDGFPVFDVRQLESTVEVTASTGGLTYLKLPMRVIQTPLTLDGPESKEMLSGTEAVQAVESIPNYTIQNVEDLRIGLGWNESEESTQVIHFEPAWYIKEENEWYVLEEFVEERGGTADGF